MLSKTLLGLLALASTALTQEQHPISSDNATTYRDALLSLHKSLVSIPSLSGHEQDVGFWLATHLESLGYRVMPQNLTAPEDTSRLNVLAQRLPAHRRPKVLVSSHIDTVPPYIPYSISDGEVDGDTVIMGRGSSDAKASVAAQIIAIEELVKEEVIQGDELLLAFVVGEEVDGVGMRRFGKWTGDAKVSLAFEAGVFGEPTEGKLACGHKGIATCTINAKGKAGHSGYPWLGKSATDVLVRALVKILDTDLGSSERFGNTTTNIGTIEGGVAANVIPEHASAKIAMRIATGNQTTGWPMVRERLAKVLEEVDAEALSMECHGVGYGPIECECDVDGFEGMIVNYGTDVANLEGDHIRYLYGPGSILVAHGADENVKVRELEAAVEGYKKLIKHALGQEYLDSLKRV